MLPILRTDEPVCPEGKLSCGNGECVDKELFCNGKPDCKDESDENACSKCRFDTASFGNRVGTAIVCTRAFLTFLESPFYYYT